MGKEIERKYLVHQQHWNALEKGEGIRYRQGYMVNSIATTIRVRIAGNKGYLTIKGTTTGISRTEFEYEIPLVDAEELLDIFCEATIEKIRYLIPCEDKTWEVDVFLKENEGLIVAEIELQSEDETFLLPSWIDREVSDDPHYYNSYLVQHPFKTWDLKDLR